MTPLFRLVSAVLLFLPGVTRAEITLPKVLGDHMVLQRDRPVPIWGRAAPQEKISVRFAGQEKTATADAEGRWEVRLAPLSASAEPHDLTIVGTQTLVLRDLLVGDVWLCSGQSNMEMAVGVASAGAQPETAHDPKLAEEIKTVAYPAIRLFHVEKKLQPPEVVSAGWTDCRGEALARFSAIGFFFGRELHRELGVPIGLIQSAWGGSRIEEWISDNAYASLEKILGADAPQMFERDAKLVSRDYDGMIAPLAPFALRGVLWYQGESQIIAYNDGLRYADKLQVLVDNWRALWDQPALPFYSVQLAPFVYTGRKDKLAHADDELPKLWEAQLLSTAIPHTGLVPLTDTVTDVKNIHPFNKPIVAHRLAALALADTYRRPGSTYNGPRAVKIEFRGAKAIAHFNPGAPGFGQLTSRDGQPLTGFELAGADGRFFPAEAGIHGDTVEVTSAHVPQPAKLRFGWHETAQPNLANRDGWPAYPFRSDAPQWPR